MRDISFVVSSIMYIFKYIEFMIYHEKDRKAEDRAHQKKFYRIPALAPIKKRNVRI